MNNQTSATEYLAPHSAQNVKAISNQSRFVPAFMDKRNGRIEIARTRVGLPATYHVIEWLPREWASTVTDTGRVSCLHPQIVSGFVHNGIFYTREEATKFKRYE